MRAITDVCWITLAIIGVALWLGRQRGVRLEAAIPGLSDKVPHDQGLVWEKLQAKLWPCFSQAESSKEANPSRRA
jgi:hypothetical protein